MWNAYFKQCYKHITQFCLFNVLTRTLFVLLVRLKNYIFILNVFEFNCVDGENLF